MTQTAFSATRQNYSQLDTELLHMASLQHLEKLALSFLHPLSTYCPRKLALLIAVLWNEFTV
jgi:hypothetical protein